MIQWQIQKLYSREGALEIIACETHTKILALPHNWNYAHINAANKIEIIKQPEDLMELDLLNTRSFSHFSFVVKLWIS